MRLHHVPAPHLPLPPARLMNADEKRLVCQHAAENVFGFVLSGAGWPLDGPPASPFGGVTVEPADLGQADGLDSCSSFAERYVITLMDVSDREPLVKVTVELA